MIESFAINVISSLFYDLAGGLLKRWPWSNPQIKELKEVYKRVFITTLESFAQEGHEDELEPIKAAIETLVNDTDARQLLLDLALDDQAEFNRAALELLCEKHNLDFDKLMPFFQVFFDTFKKEVHIAAEKPDSSLFQLASLRSQIRTEAGVQQIQNVLYSILGSNEQFESLQDSVSNEVAQQLDIIRRNWNIGRTNEVLAGLQRVKSNENLWKSLKPEVQAQWLRTECIVLLEIRNDVETARELFLQAKQLASNHDEEKYIQALINFNEEKYSETLEVLTVLIDERAKHLKAVTYISLNQYEDAQAILDSISDPANIHIHFTKARLALLQQDVEKAKEAIQLALKIAPHSEDMRFWLAQLRYLSVLSPAVQPSIFQELPEPIPSMFYRTTPKYRLEIAKAGEVFLDLAENGRADLRSAAQIWHLACLLNQADTIQHGIEYCKLLIEESPLYYVAIIWAIERNLPLSCELAIPRIEQEIEQSKANSRHITSLGNYYLHQKRTQDAIGIFQKSQVLFKGEHWRLWLNWMILLHLADGNLATSKEYLLQIPDEKQQCELTFAVLARQGEKSEIEKFLEGDFSNNPSLLLNICDYMFQQGDWSWAARHSEILIKEVGTNFAFDLVLEATYRRSELQQCLSVIEEISKLFHPEPLPWKYRNLEVQCLYEQGHLKIAYSKAQSLYEDVPLPDTLMTFAMACQSVGDIESFTIIARDLLHEIELPSSEILRIARFVSLGNLDLAIQLWRKAMRTELVDEAVMPALMLANTLGTKAETDDLFPRMNDISQRNHGDIQLLTLKESIDILRDRQKFIEHIIETHRKGNVPIHLAANSIGASLVWLYHSRLDYVEEAKSLHPLSALLARHGGRPLLSQFPLEALKGRLALDITSILLLEHFEILKMVEHTYQPIRIPHSLMLALMEMLLKHHEADRENIGACKEIIQLVDRKQIKVVQLPELNNLDTPLVQQMGEEWVQAYHFIEGNEGYYVNFLPLRKIGLEDEAAEITEEVSQYLIDLRAIVESLLRHHVITKSEYDRTLQALGSIAAAGTTLVPKQGVKLIFFANTLELLAGLNLLKKVAQTFEVVIYEKQVRDARNVVEGDTENSKVIKWLSRLIQHLFQGIINGTYEVLPMYSPEASNAGRSIQGFSETVLASLIDQCQEETDIILTDDRYFNALSQHNKAKVLTSADILRALAETRVMNTEEFYQLLMRFRQSNIRYIPYSSDEILYHLIRDFHDDTLTVENSVQLNTMRDYIYACVSQTDILQLTPSENVLNQAGERGFLELSFIHMLDAVCKVWINLPSLSTRSVLSSWVLENLYLPCREIFLNYKIFDISAGDDRPYAELFDIARYLRVLPYLTDFSNFSDSEKYRIWLWHWIEGHR